MKQSGKSRKEIAKEFGFKNINYVSVVFGNLKRAHGITMPNFSNPKVTADIDNVIDIQAGVSEGDIGTRVKKLIGGRDIKLPGLMQLSDKQLLEYRNDPAKFASDCVMWHGDKLILDDYQIAWINDDSKFKIANKSRRIGFSFATAFKAFHTAIFYPGSVELFVSIKEDRAKELMDYVYQFADSNPDLFDGLFVERSRLQCYLTNSSRIYSLSNSPSGVRGIPQIKDVDVYLDEFAHIRTGQDEKLFQALIASVSLGGTMSIWSTPFGRRGKYYDIWRKSDENHANYNGFKRHEIPWWDCKRLNEDVIEAIKRATDPITFRQEFCCEFVSTGAELFYEDDILEAEDESVKSDLPLTTNPIYFGVDFAMKHDSTAIVIIERGEDMVYVRKIVELKNRGVAYITQEIMSLYRKFRPVNILCDETGMGIPLVRTLKEEGLTTSVVGVPFSNPRKDALIMGLYKLFRDGTIKIPIHKELKNQLMRLERQETSGGAPKYSGKVDGQKDDMVWALALAVSSEGTRWNGYVYMHDNQEELEDMGLNILAFA